MTSRGLAAQLQTLLPSISRTLFRPQDSGPLAELTVGQLRMVRLLFSGSRSVSCIAEDLGMSISAAMQMAGRLEQMGMVTKKDHAADRRVKILMLSRTGRSLMQKRRTLRVQRIEMAIGRLSAESRDPLLAALSELHLACQEVSQSTKEGNLADLAYALEEVAS